MVGTCIQRHMKTENVGGGLDLFQRTGFHSGREWKTRPDIVCNDMHVKSAEFSGKGSSCVSESNDANGFAFQLCTTVGIPDPFPLFYLCVTRSNFFGQPKQHSQ